MQMKEAAEKVSATMTQAGFLDPSYYDHKRKSIEELAQMAGLFNAEQCAGVALEHTLLQFTWMSDLAVALQHDDSTTLEQRIHLVMALNLKSALEVLPEITSHLMSHRDGTVDHG